MNARDRILMIRLMEKLEKYPAYAILLGIEAAGAVKAQNRKNEPKGLANA